MSLKEILRMKGGEGEFGYAHTSTIQDGGQLAVVTKRIVEKIIQDLLAKVLRPGEALAVADLGCGVGSRTLALASIVKETVKRTCENDGHQLHEILLYFSDLPSNDFNFLFKDLARILQGPAATSYNDGINEPMEPLCFVMGAPGSFYGRLFSRHSLHLVHSSYTIHWLSQVPLGLYNDKGVSIHKGSTCISEKSPSAVVEAYRTQFQHDFMSFLRYRSEEVVYHGYLLLAVLSTPSGKVPQLWATNLLGEAIDSLVSKGLIEEETRDSFDIPCYFPSIEDIQVVVEEEGSFVIEHDEKIVEHLATDIHDIHEKSEAVAKLVRAIYDVLVSQHFGDVWDALHNEITEFAVKCLEKESIGHLMDVVLLTRKCDG